jgi:hypothetical protein
VNEEKKKFVNQLNALLSGSEAFLKWALIYRRVYNDLLPKQKLLVGRFEEAFPIRLLIMNSNLYYLNSVIGYTALIDDNPDENKKQVSFFNYCRQFGCDPAMLKQIKKLNGFAGNHEIFTIRNKYAAHVDLVLNTEPSAHHFILINHEHLSQLDKLSKKVRMFFVLWFPQIRQSNVYLRLHEKAHDQFLKYVKRKWLKIAGSNYYEYAAIE